MFKISVLGFRNSYSWICGFTGKKCFTVKDYVPKKHIVRVNGNALIENKDYYILQKNVWIDNLPPNAFIQIKY